MKHNQSKPHPSPSRKSQPHDSDILANEIIDNKETGLERVKAVMETINGKANE